jgi:hypothetical protein
MYICTYVHDTRNGTNSSTCNCEMIPGVTARCNVVKTLASNNALSTFERLICTYEGRPAAELQSSSQTLISAVTSA